MSGACRWRHRVLEQQGQQSSAANMPQHSQPLTTQLPTAGCLVRPHIPSSGVGVHFCGVSARNPLWRWPVLLLARQRRERHSLCAPNADCLAVHHWLCSMPSPTPTSTLLRSVVRGDSQSAGRVRRVEIGTAGSLCATHLRAQGDRDLLVGVHGQLHAHRLGGHVDLIVAVRSRLARACAESGSANLS